MKIFYFTSTGNCLEVAKKLGGTPISISSVLRGKQHEFEDDMIGIIVPNYQGDIPSPVKEFLQKVKLKSNYFFGIITYGAYNGNANEMLLHFGQQYGIQFDYINSILMVDNAFIHFDMEKQIRNLPKKKVDKAIAKIKAEIEKKTAKIYDINLRRKLVGKMMGCFRDNGRIRYSENFSIEDTCSRCGICLKVCPIDNITLENKPVMQNKCIRCGACTQNCPQNAIRYKGEKSKARYRNPNVSISEIINANDK